MGGAGSVGEGRPFDLGDVGFVLPHAVHVDVAVAQRQRVAGQADHPLDEDDVGVDGGT